MDPCKLTIMILWTVMSAMADYEPRRDYQCPGGGYCATTNTCCSMDDRCADYRSYDDDGCVEQWTIAKIWYTFVILSFLVLICVAVTIYCRRRHHHAVLVTTTTTAQPHQQASAQYPPVIAPNGATLYPTFMPDGRPIYPVDTSTGQPVLPQGVTPGPDGQPLWMPVATGVPVAVHPPPLSVAPQQAATAPPAPQNTCEAAPCPPAQQSLQSQNSQPPPPQL